MALEESGLRLVAEGGREFEGTLAGANDAVAGFGQAAERAASPLDAFGEIATGALRRVGEIAINALGAAAGAVGGFISDSFAGALEAEQTLTRISSVIESTGNAAGLSVSDVERLGNEFAHLAGGSDDAVLAIQEMALRLGTISAEEMPDFIQTTLDMAAATGVDAVAAARILAVAQEDPISALGRLRKSGILLTEAQEEQIKKMQEAGDSAGAYSLLIEQVGIATGGAALANSQTLAGQMEIFKNTLGEAGEGIAMSFLPILTQLFQGVIAPAIPIVELIALRISKIAEAFVSGGFEQVFAIFEDGSSYIGALAEALGLTEQQGFAIGEMFNAMYDAFNQVLIALQPLQVAFGELLSAIGIQFPPAQSIVVTVMAAITDAVTIAAGFISGTLVPALTSAVEWVTLNWPTIQATIENVMTAVQTIVSSVVTFITSFWQSNGATIIGDTQSTWSDIQTFITNAITTIQTVVQTVLGAIQSFWDAHGQSIITIVTVMTDRIQFIITTWTQIIQALWEQWGGTITAITSAIWTAIQTVIANAITIIGAIIDGFAALLTGDWQALGQALDLIWRTLWSTIGTIVATGIAAILAIIRTGIGNVVESFLSVNWAAVGSNLIDSIAGGISNAVGNLIGAAQNAAQSAYQSILDALHIGSPSRVGLDIGENFGGSFAVGIQNRIADVVNAGRALADAAANATATVLDASRAGGTATDPWAAILGGGTPTGQGGVSVFGPGGGTPVFNPPVSAPPADSFGFGGGPVSAPPITFQPPITGGGGGGRVGEPINISIDARGASPTETQTAVTRALRDVAQYGDTRLRLRGAM